MDSLAQAPAVPSLLPAPKQIAPGPAETVEGAHHHEVAHGAGADGAAEKAIEKSVEGGVGAATLAFGDDGLASVLAEVADVVEPDAHAVGLNNLGCGDFEISIPWPQVGRLGEGTGQQGGPSRGLPVFGRGAIRNVRRQTCGFSERFGEAAHV